MKMCIYNFFPFNQQTVDPSFYFFLLLLPGGRAFFFLGMDQYNSNIIIIIIIIFKRPVKMTGLSRIAHIISKTATVIIIFLDKYARKRATTVEQVNRSVLCQVTTCFRKIIMKLKELKKINWWWFYYPFLKSYRFKFSISWLYKSDFKFVNFRW